MVPNKNEGMTVPDYMKGSRIPTGPNQENIVELLNILHATQTQVIILTYNKEDNKKTEQHKKRGRTYLPYINDNKEVELLLFNYVQSIIQQTQQHMFKQLEQCMQQAYSGLLLGTSIRAKEYAKQFKENKNTGLLTKTQCLNITLNKSDRNNESNPTTGRGTFPFSSLPKC